MSKPIQLLNATAIEHALKRMAYEIAERNAGDLPVAAIGIHQGGVAIARRLVASLEAIWGRRVEFGTIDIGMHRDDLDQRAAPDVHPTEIPFHLNEKRIILVDDVLFSGRTVRAALDSLTDFGRPQSVQLAVLIDRGHRELPIQADYVGKALDTALADRVDVRLEQPGEEDAVYLIQG